MEKIKVYIEAIGFLTRSIGKWIGDKLVDDEYFAYVITAFLLVLGWAMIYYPYVITAFTLLSPFILAKEYGIGKTISFSGLFFVVVFVASLIISLFYDKDIKEETVIINITKPKYEITSKSNFILQDGNVSQVLELNDAEFMRIKNSDCKKIQKVSITKRKKGFPEVYSEIDSEIRCDGKVIK